MNSNNPNGESLDQVMSAGNSAESSAEERYVSAGGAFCPHCGSRDIVGGGIEVDGATAFQAVQCQACESDWVDQYTLSGFSDLVIYEADASAHADSASDGAR